MSKELLELLQGDERLYPHELEKQYPHVMGKIIELWPNPQAATYFAGLIMTERGGREGFPPKVLSEIFHLSLAHKRICPETYQDAFNSGKSADEQNLSSPEMPIAVDKNCSVMQKKMFDAVEARDSAAVTQLLGRGIDPNVSDERGMSPLMIAASLGDAKIARLLVQGGANIQTRDNDDYTPLHWAAHNGHANVARLLLGKGADPDARSNFGWTPLMLAATHGHLDAAKILIAAGCNVNLSGADGWTALHKAAANNYVGIIKLLLTHLADRHMRLQDGRTALLIANQNKNWAAISMLSDMRAAALSMPQELHAQTTAEDVRTM